jgi:hypothetical protein
MAWYLLREYLPKNTASEVTCGKPKAMVNQVAHSIWPNRRHVVLAALAASQTAFQEITPDLSRPRQPDEIAVLVVWRARWSRTIAGIGNLRRSVAATRHPRRLAVPVQPPSSTAAVPQRLASRWCRNPRGRVHRPASDPKCENGQKRSGPECPSGGPIRPRRYRSCSIRATKRIPRLQGWRLRFCAVPVVSVRGSPPIPAQ